MCVNCLFAPEGKVFHTQYFRCLAALLLFVFASVGCGSVCITMGKKHKKYRSEWRSYDAGELGSPGDQSQCVYRSGADGEGWDAMYLLLLELSVFVCM